MRTADLEQRIGLKLPDDYRQFLEHHRDAFLPGTLVFPFTEKTPFGETGMLDELKTLDCFNEDGIHLFEDVGMLIIGNNLLGYPTCLSLRPPSRGQVFYYDLQQRVFWPDSQFHSMSENLADSVIDYLQARSLGHLVSKDEGMESFYLVADSFSAFQVMLQEEEVPLD